MCMGHPPIVLAAQAAQNAQQIGQAVMYARTALNLHKNPLMLHYAFHKLSGVLAMKRNGHFAGEDTHTCSDSGSDGDA